MNQVRRAAKGNTAIGQLTIRHIDVVGSEIENRVARLALFLVTCGQKQTYAVAIEECKGAKCEQMRKSQHIAVPRHRGVDVAHLAGDLANRSQSCSLSHRM